MDRKFLAQAQAKRIILEHASDIEELSISEMLEDLALPLAEHDELCDAVATEIVNAKVTVHWEGSE